MHIMHYLKGNLPEILIQFRLLNTYFDFMILQTIFRKMVPFRLIFGNFDENRTLRKQTREISF